MEQPPEERNPAASLTDDLLVEILRRAPIRSLCRFKCVSRGWRNLISDPAHRKKLPQTLAGFFYCSLSGERFPVMAHHFTNVTGKGPEPDPDPNGDELPPFHYAVCNPATQKWVMLPDGSWTSGEARTARLGFDPAVSSHFHVVEYVLDEVNGGDDVMLYDIARSVFLNGFMHMLTFSHGIAVVDMDGKTWRTIPVPSDDELGCIHQAQGRLCFINVDDTDVSKLSIWILENHGTHEWTSKHSVRTLLLFRQKNLRFDLHYTVVTVHPECNLIYFVYGWDNTLMAYEMDSKEVRVIINLGHDCSEPYLPYVPLFSEALADEQ
ncbi:hypothetical protein PVAP13_9KG367640 [Panicum virgatum]|uniref:F-box domain-containing protein n=1 Tax=Panicum virgatum TaxID=38727 RepID=A0A8T0NNN9_PANVG|nr:hypothetical protein PVAP13_9KG367640 [Panicum virgatum]